MVISELKNKFDLSMVRLNVDPDESSLVYILTDKDEIVYVGMSCVTNLSNRIRAHKRDKDFDGFYIFKCNMDRGTASILESLLISSTSPRYNIDVYEKDKALSVAISNIINTKGESSVIKASDHTSMDWCKIIDEKMPLPDLLNQEQLKMFKKAWRGWYHQSTFANCHDDTRSKNYNRYLIGKKHLEYLGYEITEYPTGNLSIRQRFKESDIY